jgi:hypothetical protein
MFRTPLWLSVSKILQYRNILEVYSTQELFDRRTIWQIQRNHLGILHRAKMY